jgi:hypothetical protein
MSSSHPDKGLYSCMGFERKLRVGTPAITTGNTAKCLSCVSGKNARQSVCRAFLVCTVNRLCRALMLTHGKLIPERIKNYRAPNMTHDKHFTMTKKLIPPPPEGPPRLCPHQSTTTTIPPPPRAATAPTSPQPPPSRRRRRRHHAPPHTGR